MPDRKRGRGFGKLKSRLGYTLTEAIVSVLIIALLAVAISSGLSVAMKVYKQSLFTSNSEILEDTINAALSDVLRFASEVNTPDSGVSGSGSSSSSSSTGSGTGSGSTGDSSGSTGSSSGAGDNSGSSGSSSGAGSGAITTNSSVHFCNTQYKAVSADGYIGIKGGYIYVFADSSDTTGALLVNTGAYDDIKASDFYMRYDTSTKTFTGSYTLSGENGDLVKDCSFTFRTVVE